MGLKLAKKKNKTETSKPNEEIKEDPRKIKEVAEWNRLRLIVYHESAHQAWGYPLYALHRAGKISDAQRHAGDTYFRAVQDYKRTQQIDLDKIRPEAHEFKLREINRAKDRYKDLVSMLGLGRRFLDALIFDHEYPVTERQMKLTRACLERLVIYFGPGS